MTDDAARRLETASIHLLFKQPFFGAVSTSLRRVAAAWTDTLATDGAQIFYSPVWVLRHQPAQLLFGIAHEVGHCICQHFLRHGDRDPEWWNMAGDYWINDFLIHTGLGTPPDHGILHDARYDHRRLSTEDIYDDLQRRQVPRQAGFDDHLVAVVGAGGAPTADPAGRIPVLDSAAALRHASRLNATMLSARSVVAADSIPGFAEREIGRLTAPTLDWRAQLRHYCLSARRAGRSYAQYSRRQLPNILRPGRARAEKLRATVAIDASASTTPEMVREFVSELRGMMQAVADFELTVCSFDTRVYGVQTFTPHTRAAIHQYRISGNGGTQFECVFEWLKTQPRRPRRLVVFTDGLPNRGWGDPIYCDTLFVIHSHPQITAPFGATVHFPG